MFNTASDYNIKTIYELRQFKNFKTDSMHFPDAIAENQIHNSIQMHFPDAIAENQIHNSIQMHFPDAIAAGVPQGNLLAICTVLERGRSGSSRLHKYVPKSKMRNEKAPPDVFSTKDICAIRISKKRIFTFSLLFDIITPQYRFYCHKELHHE